MSQPSGEAATVPSRDPESRGAWRVPVTVYPSATEASAEVAREIADLIRLRASRGEHVVLGLATGSSPLGVYRELIRWHQQAGLSFRCVVTFNLDEYWPMPADSPLSYHQFMRRNLFEHLDLDPSNIHLPDGAVAREEIEVSCQAYERAIREAGGIDYQILGIGRSGHIGFNEPGSDRTTRTRLVELALLSREDLKRDLGGGEEVPRLAITMGVGTILEARQVVLLAFGRGKAAILERAVLGRIGPALPASFLRDHPGGRFVVDQAAASLLR
ncbi:MAG: 6-phosphogluconolactonase [Planctomycetota bacterium]